MTDKPSSCLKPILYLHRINELQTIARANGYALAIHGSLQRDLDAIAVPWTKNAVPSATLVERICEQMELLVAEGSPTPKYHGRQAWTLMLRTFGFIDLSVMPRLDEGDTHA